MDAQVGDITLVSGDEGEGTSEMFVVLFADIISRAAQMLPKALANIEFAEVVEWRHSE